MRCLACEEGVPLVNVTADRPDLPDTWTHQYGGEPGTISPCATLAQVTELRSQVARIREAVEEFATEGMIDRDIADAVLFHVRTAE